MLAYLHLCDEMLPPCGQSIKHTFLFPLAYLYLGYFYMVLKYLGAVVVSVGVIILMK